MSSVTVLRVWSKDLEKEDKKERNLWEQLSVWLRLASCGRRTPSRRWLSVDQWHGEESVSPCVEPKRTFPIVAFHLQIVCDPYTAARGCIAERPLLFQPQTHPQSWRGSCLWCQSPAAYNIHTMCSLLLTKHLLHIIWWHNNIKQHKWTIKLY